MIDHMLLHCIVNGQLGYPGFQTGDVMRSDRFWPFAAVHARLLSAIYASLLAKSDRFNSNHGPQPC
ncbi:hypothetical protein [Pseudomonas antarctica]|uniref:hypothetical protein n=1 Tax=Pseudomonas antarctica TaxID=219572 RepID=UPI003F75103E